MLIHALQGMLLLLVMCVQVLQAHSEKNSSSKEESTLLKPSVILFMRFILTLAIIATFLAFVFT